MANLLTVFSSKAARQAHAGYIYVGLLLLVAMFGLASLGAARVLASSERAEKETELLFVGAQIRSAIASYYLSSPGAPRLPRHS